MDVSRHRSIGVFFDDELKKALCICPLSQSMDLALQAGSRTEWTFVAGGCIGPDYRLLHSRAFVYGQKSGYIEDVISI